MKVGARCRLDDAPVVVDGSFPCDSSWSVGVKFSASSEKKKHNSFDLLYLFDLIRSLMEHGQALENVV